MIVNNKEGKNDWMSTIKKEKVFYFSTQFKFFARFNFFLHTFL
jgi:hypothetical protein